jgi:hypothetical protein
MRQPSDAGPWATLTPNDTVEVQNDIRAIYVGGTPGNLVVNFGAGDVSIPVLANTIYPMAGLRLVKTTSTATPLYSIR